jgi:tetratricopeptide (TPR) repeat protein
VGSRFKVLGHTQLLIDGHFTDQWGGPKVRGVLGALLLRPRQAVSIDELVDWVWAADRETRPKLSTFHTYAKRIRDGLRQMDSPPRLIPDHGAYLIDVAREDVDYFESLALFNQARLLGQHGDHAAARETLLSGVDLWSDRLLTDLDGEHAQNWRQAMRDDTWLTAQSDLLRELSALGEFDEALRRLQELPAQYQLSLLIVKRRLEALYGLHRGKDTTTYFLRIRKRMVADDRVDEADELTRFHEALLHRADEPAGREPDGGGTPAEPAPRVPHMLPHDVPDLVGRDELLDTLDAVAMTSTGLPANRLVALDGPPGIGKTALAVHWAHHAVDQFPGGQLYMDLNGAGDGDWVTPAAVVDQFLAEFDFPVERIPTAAGRAAKLRGLLSGRRAIVLLDNAASTEHVRSLVDCLPCLVLITSQRRLSGLGRRGATNVSVPPLSYRATSGWLADRVGTRAFSEPDQVTVLASMCGGHALMLHVVTEHVVKRPMVHLADFVEELRDEQALLELGDDADNPGGSVLAAFTTAYRALDAAERRLFALLGAHPGPDISVAAAAALAGQEVRTVRRLLDALVDASLLTEPEVRGRYRFHDLLRMFAATCVSADEFHEERRSAEQRILNFYQYGAHNADMVVFPRRVGLPLPELLDGVAGPSFPNEATAIRWCTRERANLNAVIRMAGQRGFHEYATLLPNSTGEIFLQLGYYEDAKAALKVAMESVLATGDRQALAFCHNNIGFILLNHRDLESARSHLTIAAQLCDEIHDDDGSAIARFNLARVQVEQGNYRPGIDGLLAALDTFRRIDAVGPQVHALYRLAEAHRRAHDLDRAISFAMDGLWLAEKLGDELNRGACLTELSAAYYEKGDLPSATGYAERALAIHTHLNGLTQAGRTSTILAAINRIQGDLSIAERHARAAVNFCRSGKDARSQAAANNVLADILFTQGRHDEAMTSWSTALAIFEDLGDAQAESVRTRLAELAAALPLVTPEQTRPLTSAPDRRVMPPS